MQKSDSDYSLSFLYCIVSLPHLGQVILKFFFGIFLFNRENPPNSSKSQSGTGSSNLHFVHLKIYFGISTKIFLPIILTHISTSVKDIRTYSISLYFGILDILIYLFEKIV